MLSENLRHCLLTPEKLRSELRSKGHDSLPQIFAIVLEPTGTFAVITDGAWARPAALGTNLVDPCAGP